MKKRIISWLKIILGIRQLEIINERLIRENMILKNQLDYLNHEFETIKKVIHIATDVNPTKYGRSWAVICLKGKKQDFVSFYDLDDKNILEIQRFLKYFDRENKVIDAPREMIKLFK